MPARPRLRDLGLSLGLLPPGPLNALTDVAGVQIGHRTIIEGDNLRTGVTAILPHDGNLFQQKVPGGLAVGNGFGKLVGVTQIEELGLIETPIVLTNTVSVFAAADAVVAYMLGLPGNEFLESVNPVVGECNDGFLSDIRGRHITEQHVRDAIAAATAGPIAEGCVGGGTGTRAMGFKGGIGTSSRQVLPQQGSYTVGVLAQTNFAGQLTLAGVPIGRELGVYWLKKELEAAAAGTGNSATPQQLDDEPDLRREGGSCMLVVATDAPLNGRQLARLARRAILGLGAVGSPMTHQSGEYVIAFSAHPEVRVPFESDSLEQTSPLLRDDALSPLFQACREATDEAILNSVLRATTMVGRKGHTSEAISVERVVEICRRYRVLGE